MSHNCLGRILNMNSGTRGLAQSTASSIMFSSCYMYMHIQTCSLNFSHPPPIYLSLISCRGSGHKSTEVLTASSCPCTMTACALLQNDKKTIITMKEESSPVVAQENCTDPGGTSQGDSPSASATSSRLMLSRGRREGEGREGEEGGGGRRARGGREGGEGGVGSKEGNRFHLIGLPGLMIPTALAIDLAVMGWSPVTMIT